MVFADLGSNLGYFSLMGASLVGPGGKVIAFDASRQNAALLWTNAQLNHFQNIEVHPNALLNRRTMLAYESNGSNGWVRAVSAEQENVQHLMGLELIYADTLDAALAPEPRLDVIKIDVEGAEYLVFEGAKESLRKHRPVIISEFFPDLLLRQSDISTPTIYLEQMIDAGYVLSVIRRPDGEQVDCGTDVDKVMSFYEEERRPPFSATHIDFVAVPR
jgi:FkbM family methyltransferase